MRAQQPWTHSTVPNSLVRPKVWPLQHYQVSAEIGSILLSKLKRRAKAQTREKQFTVRSTSLRPTQQRAGEAEPNTKYFDFCYTVIILIMQGLKFGWFSCWSSSKRALSLHCLRSPELMAKLSINRSSFRITLNQWIQVTCSGPLYLSQNTLCFLA